MDVCLSHTVSAFECVYDCEVMEHLFVSVLIILSKSGGILITFSKSES